MMKKCMVLLSFCLMTVMMITGCQKAEQKKTSDTLNIVATTTMLADLSRVIGGEHVNVDGLMGPGIDPHYTRQVPEMLH